MLLYISSNKITYLLTYFITGGIGLALTSIRMYGKIIAVLLHLFRRLNRNRLLHQVEINLHKFGRRK